MYQQDTATNLTLTSRHALRVDNYPSELTLDDCLKQFWDLGIAKDEPSVYDKFMQKFKFDGQRYEVSLPWKEHHPPLLDNYELSCQWLTSVLMILWESPALLEVRPFHL